VKSYWFNRLERDIAEVSPQLRLIPAGHGLWRVYYNSCYVHEINENLTANGYDIEEYNERLESRGYYEEYEDQIEVIRTVKNYAEGYWDALEHVKHRLYLLRNNDEFYEQSRKAYETAVIK
jgi:hypothetical protein